MFLVSKYRPVCIAITAIGCFCSSAAQNPVYQDHPKPAKATVSILALSSGVHQAYAGSQDVYFAEMQLAGDQGSQLVILVDRYRGYDDPIRHSVLEARQRLRMRVLRDEKCDSPAALAHMPLSRADLFDARLSSELQAQGTTSLRCFTVDHDATRLASRH